MNRTSIYSPAHGYDLTNAADIAFAIDGNNNTGMKLWNQAVYNVGYPTDGLAGYKYIFTGWTGSAAIAPTMKLIFSELNINTGYQADGSFYNPSLYVFLKNGASTISQVTLFSLADVTAWKLANGGASGPWTMNLTGLSAGSVSNVTVEVWLLGAPDMRGSSPTTTDNWLKLNEITLEA